MTAKWSVVVVLLAAARAEAVPALCTESNLCRLGNVPKGASALAIVGGRLWAVGKKGGAWDLGDGSSGVMAPAVKTGFKKDLTAAASLGSGLVAVGPKGAAVRFDGSLWTADKTPAKTDLMAVWAAAPDAAWAVGKKGTIIKWDGSKWTAEASGTKVDLYAVWGSRAGDVWAVGGSGTILHHDGSAWTTSRTGNAKLLAVGGVSDKLAWTVGELGAALRWNGRQWEVMKSGVAADLSVLHVWSQSELLTLDSEGGGARLRYDGELDPVVAGEAGFRSVAVNRGVAWVLGNDGTLWRYAGGWQVNEEKAINHIGSMAVVGDVVVAGGDDGMIGIREGGKWRAFIPRPEGMSTVRGIGFDGKQVTAIAYNGMVVRADGKNKPVVARLPGDATGWAGVWTAPGFGIAVGQKVAMFDGKVWKLVELPDHEELESVFGLSKDAVWAAGDDGQIFFWDGKTWTQQPSGTNEDLEAIWMADKDFGVAVGRSGVAIMWDGVAWSRVEIPTKGMLRAVCGSGRGRVAIGGNSGEIVSFDGKQWVREASPTGMAFVSCAVMPNGEVIMGGQNGGFYWRPSREADK